MYLFRAHSNLLNSSMSISAQALRPSPYTIPPPRSHRMPYCNNNTGASFSSGQLQQQSPYISYTASPPSHPPGALAYSGLLPNSSPISMLPPASTTSIQLPGSPVRLYIYIYIYIYFFFFPPSSKAV